MFLDLKGSFVRRAGDEMTGNLTFSGAQTVDGVDVSAIKQSGAKGGNYTGNGADNRNINIGVNLAAKNNVNIMIGGNGNWAISWRPEISQGDLTKQDGVIFAANLIQALTSTGFQIGSNTSVNYNAYVFWYHVTWEEP